MSDVQIVIWGAITVGAVRTLAIDFDAWLGEL